MCYFCDYNENLSKLQLRRMVHTIYNSQDMEAT